ncbi:MAG: serpin family protein, partial [Clostridia bacterium]|nr:serpin family protein [Clostridia bacterium]
WAYSKWLINGHSDDYFRPNDDITKQEAAAILSRYLDYTYTDLAKKNADTIPDTSDIPKWAASEVEKCHIYGIIPAETQNFDPKASLTISEAEQWISALNSISASAVVPAQQDTFSDSLTAKLDKTGNWSVSPYSIRMCLAMVANGAQGNTKQEILDALKIEDLGTFNADIKKLLSKYDGYQKIMYLETSNSIWLNQNWFGGKGKFLESFTNKLKDNYRADAFDVTNNNSVEKVNEWVNNKTKGRIPAILTENNRKFVTAVVNAVYFKAAWENEFNTENTKKGDFKNADGSIAKTDLMHQTDHFGYYSTPGIQAVKMDYMPYYMDENHENFENFDDADFSMYIIKSSDPDIAVENLLNQAEFKIKKVKLTIPKFKVEYAAGELDKTLKALGINDMYDQYKANLSDTIDLSLLPSNQYWIDTVLHKTYIAVDEKGTEAAAVTAAVGEGAGAAARTPPVQEFSADKPFLFVIRDNTNREILFVGRYEKAD